MQGHIFESGVTFVSNMLHKENNKILFIVCALFLNYKILQFVTETAIKAFVFTLSER